MTTAGAESIAEAYALLLRHWSRDRSELALEQAYNLGRLAFSEGLGIVRLVTLHHEALASLVADSGNVRDAERAVRDAGVVAAECVSVLEMILRGFEGANATLTEANARLAAANEELDAFGYAVSHDLRAQLRTIDGYCAVLLEGATSGLGSETFGQLGVIRSAAVRMREIVEDLLRLSRATRTDLRVNAIDLTALISSIADSLAHQQPLRTVYTAIQPDMQAVGDAGLLRIAFENLLANAWKFTAEAIAPSIEVSQTMDGDLSITTIRDNGTGFDMSRADRLFRPFQRLHSDAKFPGTGIGLATVRRIVERHGGHVSATARPGRGAAFSISLPRGVNIHRGPPESLNAAP